MSFLISFVLLWREYQHELKFLSPDNKEGSQGMKRIASFEVNHDKLKPGMYTSRIDGDITTYDIRMVYPNAGTYIEPAAGHTFEHLFATYARNSRLPTRSSTAARWAARPGFISSCGTCSPRTRSRWCRRPWRSSPRMRARSRVRAASSAATGQLHDLAGAKRLAAAMIPVLADWTEEKLVYEK